MNKRNAENGQPLYHRLKREIVLGCTALTGLVLLAACLIAYRAASTELENGTFRVFSSQCETVDAYLSYDVDIPTEKLLRFAQENRLVIAVVDHGQLLRFAPEFSSEDAISLLEQASQSEVGAALYSAQPSTQKTDFTFDWAGQRYYAALHCNYRSLTQWYNVLVLQPVRNNQEMRRLCVTYTAIFLIGLLTLVGIAALLAQKTVFPVEQAHKEQLRFLASASHELKSPLAVISSSVDVLQRGLGSSEEQYRNIHAETQQMARLIDDMLVLTNGGTGRWHLQRQPVIPEDVMLSAYEMFADIMADKQQTLQLVLPQTAAAPMMADEQRLRQILTILLDNAHTYAPANTVIILQLHETAKQLRFSVIDHGQGISDAQKAEIFSYFYRTERENAPASPNTPVQGHYGLGLAVAQELARLHGGFIEITDTPQGGATFTLVMNKG